VAAIKEDCESGFFDHGRDNRLVKGVTINLSLGLKVDGADRII